MRRLAREQRALILSALTEGMGINATARLAGVSKLTVLRLLADAGTFAAAYHDGRVRDLPTERVEADELWSFVGCKARSKAENESDKHGDAWCYVAIDADHKLVISYRVGRREFDSALAFMFDLKGRLTHRIQLTSDGHAMYPRAVRCVFGVDGVDDAMLQKKYAADRESPARYSPPVCVGCTKDAGARDP